MIKATIDLAHSLSYKVVAERVYNIDKRNLLKSLDCDIMQGYLFGQPIIFDKIVKFCHNDIETDDLINSI